MGSDHVVVLSNDVVPGMGLPVAAPGLRAWGIALGLREHGYKVTLAVDANVARRVWPYGFPPPAPCGTLLLTARQVGDFVRTHRPKALIITNSNHIDALGELGPTKLIYDFFAPKVLELAQHQATPERDAELNQLMTRKLRALSRSDGVIVNGEKKIPYVEEWLGKAGSQNTQTAIVVMPVPRHEPAPPPEDGPVHAVVTGYIQPWSQPGEWSEVVTPYLEDGSLILHLLVANHWGGREAASLPSPFRRLVGQPGVRTHGTMEFKDFQHFLGRCHLSLDLFEHNPERELAMVTRTMVAVASGLATLHVPFTETSELVRRYEAGWLVSPTDKGAIAEALNEAVLSREALAERREGAVAMAAHIDPSEATKALVDLLESVAP